MTTPATTAQAGLQAGGEIDLFGANQATRDAATERLAGAQALWHEARVSVAAEVAASEQPAHLPAAAGCGRARCPVTRGHRTPHARQPARRLYRARHRRPGQRQRGRGHGPRRPAAHAVRCGLQSPGGADRRAEPALRSQITTAPVPGFDEARFTIAHCPCRWCRSGPMCTTPSAKWPPPVPRWAAPRPALAAPVAHRHRGRPEPCGGHHHRPDDLILRPAGAGACRCSTVAAARPRWMPPAPVTTRPWPCTRAACARP